MKLLRTIRLDPSDGFIFARAAEPGDWAISGAFVFADADATQLQGKELAAFRSGFLGLPSRGWSTLAQIVEVEESDRAAAIAVTAHCLMQHFGAPDSETARRAAEEEIDFAASLCTEPTDTLIALHRRCDADGTVREAYRSLRPRGGAQALPAFSFREVEGDEEPEESVDLAGLARGEKG